MNSSNNYFIVRINPQSIITDILDNQFDQLPLEIGDSLIQAFSNESHQLFYDQLRKAQDPYSAFGFRCVLANDLSSFMFILNIENIITVFALSIDPSIMKLFDDIMQINNEQILTIRDMYKRLSKHSDETDFLEEIMQLNNTLINTRRELTIKNQQLNILNQKLEKINYTDYLTGIPNRRKFFVDVYEKIQTSDYLLVMMDFNNFKIINDKYGHKRGDEALQFLATRMN